MENPVELVVEACGGCAACNPCPQEQRCKSLPDDVCDGKAHRTYTVKPDGSFGAFVAAQAHLPHYERRAVGGVDPGVPAGYVRVRVPGSTLRGGKLDHVLLRRLYKGTWVDRDDFLARERVP